MVVVIEERCNRQSTTMFTHGYPMDLGAQLFVPYEHTYMDVCVDKGSGTTHRIIASFLKALPDSKSRLRNVAILHPNYFQDFQFRR